MQYFDITFMILRDIYAFLPFLFMTHVAYTSIYSTSFSFRRYIWNQSEYAIGFLDLSWNNPSIRVSQKAWNKICWRPCFVASCTYLWSFIGNIQRRNPWRISQENEVDHHLWWGIPSCLRKGILFNDIYLFWKFLFIFFLNSKNGSDSHMNKCISSSKDNTKGHWWLYRNIDFWCIFGSSIHLNIFRILDFCICMPFKFFLGQFAMF